VTILAWLNVLEPGWTFIAIIYTTMQKASVLCLLVTSNLAGLIFWGNVFKVLADIDIMHIKVTVCQFYPSLIYQG